ncbi:replication factor-A carboxy-terminal domain protein [Trifolium pratense]|uniref:Replication factor-A carboxy-terminal domain protein n=1 Tax=Trifolium pratense TaxID=57577 RepID=A0A2K3NVN1_TRIPR|nr:replication factor-A carboxy-terminal domain protein [Trifolium pratense]
MPIRTTSHGYHLTFNEFSKVKKTFFIQDVIKDYKFEKPEDIPEVKILSHSDMLAHEDHVLSITPKATIGGLAVTDVPATYVVLGTIKEVVLESGWWYGSCCRCMQKVIPSDGVYLCQACNRHNLQVIPRYRFDIKVDDSNNSGTFNVFDKAARGFFRVSCSDMVLSQGTSIAAKDNIPSAISAIVNKSFLFMIDVKHNNINETAKNYIVKRMFDDPVLIGKFGANEIDY